MNSSRICIAFTLCVLVTAASGSNTPSPSSPSCSLLEGRTMTLRGKVSKAWDNAWPEETDENALVLDPKETVFLLTVRKPLCAPLDGPVMERPVNEREVRVIELMPPEGQDLTGFAAHVGRTRTIEGTLSTNVWWHYEASLRMQIKTVR